MALIYVALMYGALLVTLCILFATPRENGISASQTMKRIPTTEERMRKEEMMKKLTAEKPKSTQYSGKYHMHYTGPDEDVVAVGKKYGFKYERKIMKDYYEFSKADDCPSSDVTSVDVQGVFEEDSKFQGMRRDKIIRPTKYATMNENINNSDGTGTLAEHNKTADDNFTINDAGWDMQWQLHKTISPSMRVYEAWEKGYTGKDVVIAILDDGIDPNHSDLGNYVPSLSYDYIFHLPGGEHHDWDYDAHGTQTAGLAAATKNDKCIIGVAYEAAIAAVRILDQDAFISFSQVASAYTHRLDVVDISSNSWGIAGYGAEFFELNELEREAMELGIKEGRQGKGIIYLFASGNDGLSGDDCNAEGHVTNIYAIAVASVGIKGPASYGESCTSIMVAAYGGERREDMEQNVITTTKYDQCQKEFFGTSAACPQVAGVIALAMEANPELNWRDVKHLLVETSTSAGIPNAEFRTNAAGKNVSNWLGFGLINAEKMVTAALEWKSVPKSIVCGTKKLEPYKCCTDDVEDIYTVQNCPIRYLEHVQVRVHYRVHWREYTEVHLISPGGTDSRLLKQRKLDTDPSDVIWTFMTVHNWGEDPTGNWTLRLENYIENCENEMFLFLWKITLHGTVTDPLKGKPKDGQEGGHCNSTVPCTGRLECLLHYHVCVDCNLPEYRVLDGFCVQDGDVGGYCDEFENISCIETNAMCNETTNICQICLPNQRLLSGICIYDGMLGGYCDDWVPCLGNDTACDQGSSRCVLCTDGFRPIEGFCRQDGKLQGYCDADTPCTMSSAYACDPEVHVCVLCYWYDVSNINGFCMEDWTLGGYCNGWAECNDPWAGCNMTSSVCVDCTSDGYRIINTYCLEDGHLHGFCNVSSPCLDGSGCNLETSTCMDCSVKGYRIVEAGICRQEGVLGGYCDSNTSCHSDISGCQANTSTCVVCYAGNELVDGFCVPVPGEEQEQFAGLSDNGRKRHKLQKILIIATVGLISGTFATVLVFFVFYEKCFPNRQLNHANRQPNGIDCTGSTTLSDSHSVTTEVGNAESKNTDDIKEKSE